MGNRNKKRQRNNSSSPEMTPEVKSDSITKTIPQLILDQEPEATQLKETKQELEQKPDEETKQEVTQVPEPEKETKQELEQKPDEETKQELEQKPDEETKQEVTQVPEPEPVKLSLFTRIKKFFYLA
jgi:hypothetical protein